MVDHVVLHYGKKLRIVRKRKSPELFAALIETYINFGDVPQSKFLFWPTEYPGIVTQGFGINPQHYKQWGLPGHEGIDMKAPDKTNIYSVFDSVVVRVDKSTQHPNYGWHIRLQGNFRGWMHEFTFAHFSEPSKLNEGDIVPVGQVIGLADSTGNSTGSHLHFMLKQEKGGPEAIRYAQLGWPTASNGFTIIDPTPYFEELQL